MNRGTLVAVLNAITLKVEAGDTGTFVIDLWHGDITSARMQQTEVVVKDGKLLKPQECAT